MGYFKHLLHVHALLNEDSDYVIIDHWFKYNGECYNYKETEGKSKGCITSIAGNVNGTSTYLFARCFCKHFA